jgi:membrane-associated phospholipid phosphatase
MKAGKTRSRACFIATSSPRCYSGGVIRRLPLLAVAIALLLAPGAPAADLAGPIKREVKRYAADAKSLALAPLRWDRETWMRFGEGTAAVIALYAADARTARSVQDHRTSFSNSFAKAVTPFGASRAIELSGLMIAAGAGLHDQNVRDAGRDAFESELFAAGIVTVALKEVFGRARPIQEEGSHSFHPFNSRFASFPSGHATNAFAFATAVAGHFDGWLVPTIVYSIASGVAAARINDRAHFPSDVVAGALIGRAVAMGVVARHRSGRVAWGVVPILDRRGAGMLVTFRPFDHPGTGEVHDLRRAGDPAARSGVASAREGHPFP